MLDGEKCAPPFHALIPQKLYFTCIYLGSLSAVAKSSSSSVTPTPEIPSSEDSCVMHVTEIDGLTSKIKSVVSQLVSREEEVVELKELLEEKESNLRSYIKANQDLKRKVQETQLGQ